MSTIKVVCIDQTLAFNNTPVITSGGLNEDFISFTFCALWSGFTRTAVFWRNEKEVYHQTLDAEDRCQIPPEVTGEDGVIYFGVFGVNAKGVQRTSEVLNYRIHKGAITTGTKPSNPTPDIYTQILASYQDVKDEVAVERSRINNLIKLEPGSTTGDAELADIRVGYEGTIHTTAGNAVRNQVTSIERRLSSVVKYVSGTETVDLICHTDGYYGTTGQFTKADGVAKYAVVKNVLSGDKYVFDTYLNDPAIPALVYFDANGECVGYEKTGTGEVAMVHQTVVIPDGVTRIVLQSVNRSDNFPKLSIVDRVLELSSYTKAESDAKYGNELENIRTGADGTVYDTAGDAVRGQIGRLSEKKLDKADTNEFAYAIADAEGRTAFAIEKDGNVLLNQKNIGANSESIYHTTDDGVKDVEYRKDGMLDFAVADKHGNLLFYVDKGVLRVNTVYADKVISKTIDAINEAIAKIEQKANRDEPGKCTGNYDAEINMFICYGQSWSTGYDASAITTTQRYDNLMLDTGIKNEPLANLDAVATSFVPAVEITGWSSDAHNQKVGETPVSAQMNIVKQLMESEDGLTINDLSYQLLGTAPGMGSKTLAQLAKGTDYYTRLISQVQQAHDIAASMGKRLVVQAFSWVQGSLGSGLSGTYAENLEKLRQDIDTDVKAITGQIQDVKCITWQSFIYNSSLRAKQVYDQYVGAAETYPNIICSGATYHLYNVRAANLHFTSESQDWLGAYFGVAYKRTVIDGEGFEPLKPTKASKSGKILYVKFNVPQRPLVFDTERLTEAPNKGFNLYDTNGMEKTITDVSIISPDMVKIVCADDVLSTDRLTYGDNCTDTYQWVSDNHGNLRDSQGNHIQYVSGAGVSLPLHNWCVIFDKTIAELEG